MYDQASINNHEPLRKRKLLLNRSEIRKLNKAVSEKGRTLIPLRLYFKNGKVKVTLSPSETNYIVENISQPIEILEEKNIEKINVELF